VANGHEARAQIAARDTLNDPKRLVESYVNISKEYLQAVLTDSVWEAGERIRKFSGDHTKVKDNYKQGNQCGQAWVLDTDSLKYLKVRITQTLNGESECI
jgi:hypothetical protein